MSEPPPLSYAERRRHPRFENLLVAVSVDNPGTPPLVLPVRNFSMGGLAAAVEGADLARFPLHSFHELTIFDPRNPSLRQVRVFGETMRRDATGVALMWDDTDPMIARAVGGLLAAVAAHPAIEPPVE